MARMTSGAIQYGVPTKELAGDTIEAEPKSAEKKKIIFYYQSQLKPSFILSRSVKLLPIFKELGPYTLCKTILQNYSSKDFLKILKHAEYE